MRFDLHVHTTFSPCSRLTLAEICEQARSRGLDGVCVTDHNTMAAGRLLAEGVQADGLCIVFGMEYATPEGDFLLFGPFEALPPGLPAELLLRQVATAGGAAIAAHPFRTGRRASETVAAAGLCTLAEGVNGRNTATENRLAATWHHRYRTRLVAGSDAHSLSELGREATEFTVPVRNRLDLVAALRTGAFIPRIAERPTFAAAAASPPA